MNIIDIGNIIDAARRGDLERVRALVEQDPRLVHAADVFGATVLVLAAFSRRVEVARYLLDHGALINHGDLDQRTALRMACTHLHTGIVLLLQQRGADVTAADVVGQTPLMSAAEHGHDAIVRVLLEHGGSDLNAVNCHRMTACHWACYGGHPGVLRLLLEADADPTLRDRGGCTSLDHTLRGLVQRRPYPHCTSILQEWHRAYTLHSTRSVRVASSIVPNSGAPVEAGPSYLVDRTTSGLTMPTVHVSIHQQHGQPSDDVGEERHVEVGPVAVGGMVTMYAIEELNPDVFVELMDLVGTTECGDL